MTLTTIVENSNYVTDEELTSSNLLGIANTAISEVNAYCGCMLPLFGTESLTDEDAYDALPDTWQLRLLEPYYSYSISANDTDSDARDFLESVDNAIKIVTTRKITIGGLQARISSAMDTANVMQTNLTSAASLIQDADVAEESSNYIKFQILQQASASLLATANQQPQIALNLL